MTKISLTTFFLCLFISNGAYADPSPLIEVDNIMRGIIIKNVISEDRSIPKDNRKKWEESLSIYIDFNTLNAGIKQKIRSAITNYSKEVIVDDTIKYLEQKAVAFLVPRRLSDYTLSYLRTKDKIGEIPTCSTENPNMESEQFSLCLNKLTKKEVRLHFIYKNKFNFAYIFKKSDKWRLVEFDFPVTENTLAMVARWK